MPDTETSSPIDDPPFAEEECRRLPTEIPEPVKHTSALRDMHIWDHMFMSRCCRGLTFHKFIKPPAVVLDLGCGTGFWAVEAAKKWKESTIIGFDIRDVQPDASLLGLPNVRWVLGDFLDMLPFEADQFDFVRIFGIGLGVPEDKWQLVLEEVSRVMKPGAVIEVIEEDLIFPCGPDPETIIQQGHCYSPTSPFVAHSDSRSFRMAPDRQSDEIMPRSPTSSLFHAPCSMDSSSITPSNKTSRSRTPSPPPLPRSKLKSAWEDMLRSRFLTKHLTHVLSFYMASTFTNVKTHEPLRIRLPEDAAKGSDKNIPDFFEPDTVFRLKSYSRKLSIDTHYAHTSYVMRTSTSIPLWSSMHLAKAVETARACKEAIWMAYHKLFLDTLGRVRPGLTVRKNSLEGEKTPAQSLREEFELEWRSWESDMVHRMGMRQHISAEFSWEIKEERSSRRKKQPDNLDVPTPRPSSPDPADVCRALRCFTGWKPAYPDEAILG